MNTYTALKTQYTTLSQLNSAANTALGGTLINQGQLYYTRKYFSDMKSVQYATIASTPNYKYPADFKSFREAYIQVGAQKWTLQEIKTREQYDSITFIQYTSDIPQYIYLDESTKQFFIFPTPASNNNTIVFNYLYSLVNLEMEDVTATATVTNGSSVVTLSSPVLSNGYSVNGYFRINLLDGGDGVWYPISQINSSTQLTLSNNFTGTSGAFTCTIGQMPYIDPDFHDILVYRALRVYHGSINKDVEKYQMYKSLEDELEDKLNEFAGNKSMGVDLSLDKPVFNPNNFLQY